MSDQRDDFKSKIERANALRALSIPREGLVGATMQSEEALHINVAALPGLVQVQANRPVEDFALSSEHATALGLALIQNAVVARFRAEQAAAKKDAKPS